MQLNVGRAIFFSPLVYVEIGKGQLEGSWRDVLGIWADLASETAHCTRTGGFICNALFRWWADTLGPSLTRAHLGCSVWMWAGPWPPRMGSQAPPCVDHGFPKEKGCCLLWMDHLLVPPGPQLFPAVMLPCPLLGTREFVLFHDIQADTPLLKHFIHYTRQTDETIARPSDFSAQGKAQRVEFHLEKVILGLSLLLSVH